MNQQLFNHIKRWFRENRPELKAESIQALTETSFAEVEKEVQDLERGAGILYTEEFLKLNYLQSAYNFVKDVFQEYYPKEFEDYQRTPIFFEINDDILSNSVSRGLLSSYTEILTDEKFNDAALRKDISKIVNLIIL